ncbi:MAG: hypothetical protein NZM42_13955 [Gemmatales bacterium]|nr:hypothetical protein [Gemmatales bacterium]MDW8222296.1 FliG C-terminal domain-containing protein [Gemmatales bacterium]
MNGLTKAAALLVGLGASAEEVLKRLPEEQAQSLRQAMSQLQQSPQLNQWQEQALQELERLLRAQTGRSVSPTPPAEAPTPSSAAPSAQTPEQANHSELRQRLHQALQGQEEPSAVLREVPAAFLASALSEEQPRIIALVLHQLPQERAAEVLRRLPAEIRRETSLRLAQGSAPPAEVLRSIVQAVLNKVARIAEQPDLALADLQVERTAALLRQLERQDRKEVLAALEQSDAALAQRLKEMLYRAEDILRLQDRSVQKLLAEVDARTLALAVKGLAEEVREKIRRNLSRRAREALDEELAFLGSVSSAQIKQAQKQLTDTLQRLDLAGELTYEGE